MKSILYVGATLMIGASIYGFVDYKQTSQEKGFTDMYAEEKVAVEKSTEPAVVITEDKKEPALQNAVTRKSTKRAVTKKEVAEKEESLPVIKPIAKDEKMNSSGTKTIEDPSVIAAPAKEKIVAKTPRKKKVNTRLFSRGALDDRYIEPKVKADAKKEESKKMEDKEQ